MCFFVANFYGIKSLINWSRNSNNSHPRRWTHWRWQNCHQHHSLLRLDWQRKWRPAFKQLQSTWPFFRILHILQFWPETTWWWSEPPPQPVIPSSQPMSPPLPPARTESLSNILSCHLTIFVRYIPPKRIRIRWQLDFTPQWRAEDHIIKVANVSAYITGVLKTYPLI